jgi:hypothetical protein
MKSLITLVVLVLAGVAQAGSISLTWDPINDVDGVRIYQRSAGAVYDYAHPAAEIKTPPANISGLAVGGHYYFVARAYRGKLESADSNEAEYIAPDVSDVPTVNVCQKLAQGAHVIDGWTVTAKPPVPAVVYHGNTVSKTFHEPGCRYYDCKDCTVSFKTREDAIAAGYKPCGICKP